MRFYGRNRARMLGEETSSQPDPGMQRCRRCGKVLPEDQFEKGMRRLSNCPVCRAEARDRNREYQRAYKERRRRVQVDDA